MEKSFGCMKSKTIKISTASLVLVLAAAAPSRAATIAVNFVGNGGTGGTLATTDSAGVLASTNYNNVTVSSSATAIALNDDSGTASGATFTFSSGGNFAAGNENPVGGNEKLYRGYIFGNSSVTISGIPYGLYDLYTYGMNDSAGRTAQTTVGAATFYGVSPNPGAAGYIDGNSGTPFTYTRSISTDPNAGTPLGNYARFSNLSGSTLTFTHQATSNNGFLAGFQIVQVPEPSSLGLVGLGFALALTRRSRK